jgi:AraC family transcriptional regulator
MTTQSRTSFSYPLERSRFTVMERTAFALSAAGETVVVKHICTSAGYNGHALLRHVIGLHLGKPVPILHLREGDAHEGWFRPGDIVFTPAGTDVHYAHPAAVDALYLELAPDAVYEIAAQMGLQPDAIRLVNRFGIPDPTLHHIGRTLLREMRPRTISSALLVETLVVQLAIHLLQHYRDPAVAAAYPAVQPIGRDRERLQPALDYIHAHLADSFTVSDLAAEVHLTVYHFTRLFRHAFGVSPYQYVIRQRVAMARLLLRDPRLTAADVAHMVGFVDHSHLARHYKRLIGTTPRG